MIVVNDGSTDATAEIARKFDVRLIMTPNEGLSRARNRGLQAATGKIIAYIDDDARPDEHWLRFIAHAFATTDHVGIGGPNIVPVDDPSFAQCVANSPGGPTHVLITDNLAEHIPGCNMAFRVDRLREVGGFDEQFRIAGDDVDVCWKLQANGWTLGFHPGAVVYHHRRTKLTSYWRQQLNYGRAEAMLEVKWPEKYNAIGHVGWRGRLYGTGTARGIGWRPSRVYHGVWSTAAFQPLCETESIISALPIMPEWYFIIAALVAVGALGMLWLPLLLCLPLALLALGTTVLQAVRQANATSFPRATRGECFKLHATTALLHIIQPIARLWGRLSYGLTPWRRQMSRAFALPRPRETQIWDERWQPAEDRLKAIEDLLKARGVGLRRGDAFDHWDLEIRGGLFASVRTRLGIEDYPGGKQYLRFRAWPASSLPAALAALLPMALSLLAQWQGASGAAFMLALIGVMLILRAVGDCAAATACLFDVLHQYAKSIEPTAIERTRIAALIPLRPPDSKASSQALAEIPPDDEIVSVIVGGERS
jgi:hypothetical protein